MFEEIWRKEHIMEQKRDTFGSNLGFILTAIGSAVGLGNLWGFPYKMGVNGGLYSLGTAVGLFKSVVGTVLLILAYRAADKYAGYRIF